MKNRMTIVVLALTFLVGLGVADNARAAAIPGPTLMRALEANGFHYTGSYRQQSYQRHTNYVARKAEPGRSYIRVAIDVGSSREASSLAFAVEYFATSKQLAQLKEEMRAKFHIPASRKLTLMRPVKAVGRFLLVTIRSSR